MEVEEVVEVIFVVEEVVEEMEGVEGEVEGVKGVEMEVVEGVMSPPVSPVRGRQSMQSLSGGLEVLNRKY